MSSADGRTRKNSVRDARRELAYIHGRGLFARRKGEGVPIDQLADELKTAMLLPEDADSSTLVEMLKDKKRLVRRRGRGFRLNQAMYRSPLSNIHDFLQDVRENPNKKPRFLRIGTTEIDGVQYSVDIPSDAVTHIDQHHPDYDGWEDILKVINNGERIPIAALNSTGLQGTAFYKSDGELTHLVLATVKSGRKGNVVSIHTALKDNSKKANLWLELNKRPGTASQSAGGSPAHPSPQGDVLSVSLSTGNENIPPLGADSNILFQTAYHGSPRKFKKFSTKHVGTGTGAKAHGWGLYFAGDKEISEGYRNRLRTIKNGRSSGQIFEVDIPENDVLLDEKKKFSEQPEAVQKALRSLYASLSKEQLAHVREEMKERWVRRDEELDEQSYALKNKTGSQIRGHLSALETVNAVKSEGSQGWISLAGRFVRSEEYLHELYSESQIERLQKDAEYLNAEKAAVEKELAALEQKIAEIEQRIEAKMSKERDAIEKAGVDTLLSRMEGKELYAGLEIALGTDMAASGALNAAGVKGITYVDMGDGRCFVVFDDKAIKVLKTYYQEQRNALGVPLSRVTTIEGTVTREELDAALKSLAGQDLPNLIEGVTAQVNSHQKAKLKSVKATDKSAINGFARGEHRGVAAQIANAWKWAAEARRDINKKMRSQTSTSDGMFPL